MTGPDTHGTGLGAPDNPSDDLLGETLSLLEQFTSRLTSSADDDDDQPEPRKLRADFNPTAVVDFARHLAASPRRSSELDSHGIQRRPIAGIVRQIPGHQFPPSGAYLIEPDGHWMGFSVDVMNRANNAELSRQDLVNRYAWGIPTPRDLVWIVKLLDERPVVEIGAGSGYWAWMLTQHGVDIAAYDKRRSGVDNGYCLVEPYAPVLPGDPTILLNTHPDRALLLCWPPYNNPMAAEALRLYTGDLLIYCGEEDGGCCADDDFFKQLAAEWVAIDHSAWHVPWYCIHDQLIAYRRATTNDTEKA